MTKQELGCAFEIAKSSADLINENEPFNGFALPEFRPLLCTVREVARLIRWQCQRFNGTWDMEALAEIREAGRRKFEII